MENVDIIKQLLTGNHLEEKDLERCKELLHQMKIALKNRVI